MVTNKKFQLSVVLLLLMMSSVAYIGCAIRDQTTNARDFTFTFANGDTTKKSVVSQKALKFNPRQKVEVNVLYKLEGLSTPKGAHEVYYSLRTGVSIGGNISVWINPGDNSTGSLTEITLRGGDKEAAAGATIWFWIDHNVQPGTYEYTITGTGAGFGNGEQITKTLKGTIVVEGEAEEPTVTIEAANKDFSIEAGETKKYTVTVKHDIKDDRSVTLTVADALVGASNIIAYADAQKLGRQITLDKSNSSGVDISFDVKGVSPGTSDNFGIEATVAGSTNSISSKGKVTVTPTPPCAAGRVGTYKTRSSACTQGSTLDTLHVTAASGVQNRIVITDSTGAPNVSTFYADLNCGAKTLVIPKQNLINGVNVDIEGTGTFNGDTINLSIRYSGLVTDSCTATIVK